VPVLTGPDLFAAGYALAVAAPSLYLAFLAGVTFLAPPIVPVARRLTRPLRFAILVPAHDEEVLIGRTVDLLRALNYPAGQFSVHVVADNCGDATAAVARRHGAFVHERRDELRRGKGAALNWLVDQLAVEDGDVEAFVVVDADSELSPDFLLVMRDHLLRGAQVVQGLNLVSVSEEHPLVRIRQLALEVTCHLRPLAYQVLGGSSDLHGNGMCFTAEICRRYRWSESSVVEDGELFIRLVKDGHRIALARGAVARSVMPAGLRDAQQQSMRWEQAKFKHASDAATLLWRGVRRREAASLLAGLSIINPSVAILGVASLVGLLAGLVTGWSALVLCALVSVTSLVFYVMRGAWLAGMTPGMLLRLIAWAPLYALWKVRITALAALGGGRSDWARTARPE
jgi:cellulose synthase/poly-beta-1,6-N-acetylglucosamine synthase-like glycosyltransferase